ncbi:MAG: ATP-binding cassette domain-containing protein [Candidatus Omnitrophota bacterium]
MMLDIKKLSVNIGDKPILKGIDLSIKKGEVVILFGPNGSGKSTLIKTIAGFSGYSVTGGSIALKGKPVLPLLTEDRVKLGLGIMFQHPPTIRGVKLQQIARFLSKDGQKIDELAAKLSLKDHLSRDINLGFSGGEMKRSELFQLILQNPDMLLLDEPESGVDLENISIMGKALDHYLKQEGKSALIITHTGYILDYVKAARGCVMIDGKFWCAGEPKEMFRNIRSRGYEHCKVCECPQTS